MVASPHILVDDFAHTSQIFAAKVQTVPAGAVSGDGTLAVYDIRKSGEKAFGPGRS